MIKTITAISLLLLSACVSKTDNEAVKKENGKLKEKLSESLNQIKQYEVEINQLKKINAEFLEREYQANNQLEYTVTNLNDGFWKRGIVYESPNKNEKLFNAKCLEIQDTLRYFFFGANLLSTIESGAEHVLVKLYEYIPKMSREVKEIDAFTCEYNWEYDEYFFLSMEDNLIFNGDKMYYHKRFENARVLYHESFGTLLKDYDTTRYYEYNMLLHKNTATVNFSDISSICNKYDNYTISENHNIIAERNDLIIDIYEYTDDWEKRDVCLYINKAEKDNHYEKIIDIEGIQRVFSFEDIRDEIREVLKDEFALGYMSWDYKGNNLYFCNTNISLACIWKFDLLHRDVYRIVPEHDAIHPFYFEYNDTPMVFYLENNKLMVCESPE